MHLTELASLDCFRFEVGRIFRDYQFTDRVGIASNSAEQGILGAGYALIALTLNYYKYVQEGYPPFYTFLHSKAGRIESRFFETLRLDQVGPLWRFFDFWPQTQWVAVDLSNDSWIEAAKQHGVQHLLIPGNLEIKLESAKNSFKTILRYGPAAQAFRIYANQQIEDVILRGLAHLPFTEYEALAKARKTRTLQTAHESRDADGYFQSFEYV